MGTKLRKKGTFFNQSIIITLKENSFKFQFTSQMHNQLLQGKTKWQEYVNLHITKFCAVNLYKELCEKMTEINYSVCIT